MLKRSGERAALFDAGVRLKGRSTQPTRTSCGGSVEALDAGEEVGARPV
jgi:hypothetical protein